MKLQFKHQKFQADAAKAVVDVFAGQPYLTPSYMMDRGTVYQQSLTEDEDYTGWSNAKLVPELNDRLILEHIQKVQRANLIAPSSKLEGRFNLTVEMETGVGKTYTYIKTMYELNKHYGWSKFILISPIIRIFAVLYRIVAMFLSYALIGLALLCLIAICAELFNYGITKETAAYFVLGIISLAVRLGLIVSLGIIERVSETIQMRAHFPI